jgi:hypothetical protein
MDPDQPGLWIGLGFEPHGEPGQYRDNTPNLRETDARCRESWPRHFLESKLSVSGIETAVSVVVFW